MNPFPTGALPISGRVYGVKNEAGFPALGSPASFTSSECVLSLWGGLVQGIKHAFDLRTSLFPRSACYHDQMSCEVHGDCKSVSHGFQQIHWLVIQGHSVGPVDGGLLCLVLGLETETADYLPQRRVQGC